MKSLLLFVLFAILMQLCYGLTICQITREGNCIGGNVSAGIFNETTFNGTICLQRATYYQNLCGRSGITTAKATGSGVSTTVGNYCQITRRGSCPNVPSYTNSTFRDYFGERNLSAMTEEGCLQRAYAYHIVCGNTSTTTAYFGGTGLSRRQPYYCSITRKGSCPNFVNLANKTFQAIAEEDNGAKNESTCLSVASTYQTKCGNTGFTTARFVPSGNFKRVPQYCMITIEGNCIGHSEYSNRTFQDIAGEDSLNTTIESYCLQRAKSFYQWCGSTALISATYIPSGAKQYWGKYCIISRNGNCIPNQFFANNTFRAPYAENDISICFKKAIDYQCYCNTAGSTIATFSNASFTNSSTSTLCCYPPKATCGSSCVNLTNDRTNCGSCGNVCSIGRICTNSTCVSQCSASTIFCNGSCVSKTSNSNCGSCGNVCSAGTICNGSSCVTQCSGATVSCSGSCVDLTNDNNNCGSCGNVCGAGTICSGSSCIVQCLGSTINCNGSCVDLTSDNSNCGSCGNMCGSGTSCSSSTCVTQCSGSTVSCSGSCVDLTSDNSNCGSCGNICASGTSCSSSTCVTQCAGSTVSCSGSCVDLTSDSNNCGSCGNICGSGLSCIGGSCQLTCPASQTFCTDSCVDLTSDTNNCGSCANVCSAGSSCSSSSCVVGCTGSTTLCSSSCVDTSSDENNCGSCGNACTPGNEVCSNAICIHTGTLRFSVSWSTACDVDMFVKTPNQNNIWYGSTSADGGVLDRDDTTGTGPENIYWDFSSSLPPDGTYHFCALIFSGPPSVTYYATVEKSGISQSFTGTTTTLPHNYDCTPSNPAFITSITYP